MLSFLKKIFGAKPAKETPAPYKVEGTSQFPFPKPAEEKKPARAKKAPAAKKTAKKPVAKKTKQS